MARRASGTGWRGAAGAVLAASAAAAGAPIAAAQDAGAVWTSGVSHVVVPQTRGFALAPGGDAVRIDSVRAEVRILEQVAATTLDVALSNPSPRVAEAVLLLPVPPRSAVHGFTFEGAAAEPTAELLRRDDARRIYDEIVARAKDPALLEFAGYDVVRSSVFPVPAGGTQRIRLTYEQVCERAGERVDYCLPRSESLEVRVPWQIEVELCSARAIAAAYSPSHPLDTLERGEKRWLLRTRAGAASDPGPFLLSWLEPTSELSASLLAYPDPASGGGWFLLLAGSPVSRAEHARTVRREVTLVIDRSGSMAGEKMEQARAAALQILEALEPGESFQLVDYSTSVASFAQRAVVKDERSIRDARAYLASLRPLGGTNIHDALLEALAPPPAPGTLPIVLFLTDGLPTIGQTSEVAIRELVERGNPHRRRVFTFGVGHDVNVPLLDRLAEATRARSVYVLPSEDVEAKVEAQFARLAGPVLADLALETLDASGAVTTRAVRDLHPERLPDLYEHDQIVLLGRYQGTDPLRFRLTGDFFGERRTFRFDLAVDGASARNAFVARLWASRRIAWLADRIRQAGAQDPSRPLGGPDVLTDPRFREIVDEIVALSTRFGILSEYTAFLAREGTDLANWSGLVEACGGNLDRLAVQERAGAAAVNQGLNLGEQSRQTTLNYANCMWKDASERVEIAGVQQICDRAFFRRGEAWIDSGLVAARRELAPARTVELGSAEHALLVERLAREGRAGLVALRGDVLLELDGETLLVRNGN